MKNIFLKIITGIAVCALIPVCGAMEITPTVLALFIGSMAWILPFSIANKGCW